LKEGAASVTLFLDIGAAIASLFLNYGAASVTFLRGFGTISFILNVYQKDFYMGLGTVCIRWLYAGETALKICNINPI
jgi:hypothetical protein